LVNTLLRPLIVWLLLLALPCQGMAAAMVACTHRMPAHAMPAHQQHQQQADDAQLPPCHPAAPVADDVWQAEAAHAGGAKCGACAACGIGSAVLPASLPGLAAHAPAGVSLAFADSGLPSVHLAQPERPPRQHRA
jgi:hypothetical protein